MAHNLFIKYFSYALLLYKEIMRHNINKNNNYKRKI